MCKYCENEEKFIIYQSSTLDEETSLHCYIQHEKKFFYVEWCYGEVVDFDFEIPITHCPWCGNML